MSLSIRRWERLFLNALLALFLALAGFGQVAEPVQAQELDYSLGEDFEDITDESDEGLNADPLETFNRATFAFNNYLMNYLLKPFAKAYNYAPEIARDGVHNVLANMGTPGDFGNDLLQGEFMRAAQILERMAINTTVGVGGLMDVASDMGIPNHRADFGQTLATWGVGEGPYLVLPLFGPSNPRDAVGLGVDSVADPISLWAKNTDLDELTYSRFGATAIDSYSRVMDDLETIEDTSLDFYAAIRSLSRQHRRHEIKYGKYKDGPGMTEMDDE